MKNNINSSNHFDQFEAYEINTPEQIKGGIIVVDDDVMW